jgi:hypothetical protein
MNDARMAYHVPRNNALAVAAGLAAAVALTQALLVD